MILYILTINIRLFRHRIDLNFSAVSNRIAKSRDAAQTFRTPKKIVHLDHEFFLPR